ncbi:MAG: carbohydrate binding domain-containing protein, partial [Bacteroidaceae bacterium]|nr:carbohydrate binding domain-containing protein [Bacteroidaceae bacterium]
MKRHFFMRSCMLLMFLLGATSFFAQEMMTIRFVDQQGAPLRRASATLPEKIRLEGSGASATVTVVATGLTEEVQVSVTSGFSVSPQTIEAGAKETAVTVTNLSSKITTEGRLILRSGDIRTYVNIIAHGTALPQKDLSQSAVYRGKEADESRSFDASALTENGFTVELRARTDDAAKSVLPYAVTAGGLGFKSYIKDTSMGMKNSKDVFVSEKGISNPANGGTFYNTDGQYHTYRYAVTPDRRIFVYRDGQPVDTFRVADLALQPEWCQQSGDIERNLLKNGDFEGEWDFSSSQNITKFIEGWDVYPYDQYNSTQDITSEERSNEVDQNNHVLDLHRYMWNDGWAAAEISQIVDVAPNETYAFSALAKGGQYNGSALGTIRIQDLQNSDNKVSMSVSSDSYETYATDFETKANTQQLRVYFCLERAKWGASVSAFRIDDAKLTGVKRLPTAQIGFENSGADIEYFSYDATGAYAPLFARLATSADELTLNGTGTTATFDVEAENLTGDISVSTNSGFSVSPTIIKAGTRKATVTVRNLST